MTVLDHRALNRALLARQLLLTRAAMSPADALTHLIGMQAQEPLEPYIGLWSRLAGFDPASLAALLEGRQAVRTHLMRRTVHLVTAADSLGLRPLMQPVLESRMMSVLRQTLAGVDLAELAAAGREHFAHRSTTMPEAGRAVADRWPDVPPRWLGEAIGSLIPLVQMPPRGVWGQRGPARCTGMEEWLGAPLAAFPVDDLVLRYLAAYGPATTSDMRAWCGMTGLREAVTRLRPRLRVFRDERGRELFDVPDGPLPDPSTPAPPRFLPAFDNAVLGFDDRSRIIDDAHRGLSVEGARFLLVDGRVAGVWTITGDTLEIRPLTPAVRDEADAVVAAGEQLLTWHSDGGKVVLLD